MLSRLMGMGLGSRGWCLFWSRSASALPKSSFILGWKSAKPPSQDELRIGGKLCSYRPSYRESTATSCQPISKSRPRKRAPATKSLCQRQLLSASFAQPTDRHGCLVRKSESLCASNLMKHRLGLMGMIWSLKYVATEAGSGMTRYPRAVYL